MASNIASAAMWAAVFTPTADEIAKEIVAEEARLREIEEKAYWEAYWKAWDRAVKEGVIKRLRNHEEGFWLMTLRGNPIYPYLSQDDIADLIENGEIKIIAPTKNQARGLSFVWVDEKRKEAEDTTYLELLTINNEGIKSGEDRIVE